jgi:hypothetical protein
VSKTKQAIESGQWHIEDPLAHEPGAEMILPDSTAFLAACVSDAKEKILNGQISFKEALLRKKFLTQALEDLFSDKDIKDHLETEYQKENQKNILFNGAEISFTSRKNFSYDNCNDSEWQQLKYTADRAKKALEERQKFLQRLKQPLTVVQEESGEVQTIYPAAFTVTDYFTVSLKG